MQQQNKIGQYTILKKIGQGSFGQIYEVTKEQIIYAVKTENLANIKQMVYLEFNLYTQIAKAEELKPKNKEKQIKGYGFPNVYDYGEKDHFSYLIMEKLDYTLQDLVNIKLENKIEKQALISIMYNTLCCIEMIHSLGYVYRDIKPSNFMLKNIEMQNHEGKIYMIDLGLWVDHIKMKTNKKLIGTPIFCSLNAHKGFQISRRDDLESWIYMSIYFVKKLPWEQNCILSSPSVDKASIQSKQIDNKTLLYQKIQKIKETTSLNDLVKEDNKLPRCLPSIIDHVKNLQFETCPNYQLIKVLLQEQYSKIVGTEEKLQNSYFKLGHIKKQLPSEETTQKKIKINFKIEESKLKKINFNHSNIKNIFQKQ